ncbi:hypothetical protein [Thiorhodococcus minor]|uniref:Uncharacterized protein n=1 Tax=Thiorhodococcus minor TaxID=57489 RepID=A0A6M0K4D7_9GAMM|nr:hypothetical protein [Thiorhodococcus minor]NEV64131.1 hypothetical protein [Thiorhodococcus minor]
MAEQIALRFPDGTKARIKALARDGETQTALILRALDALEGQADKPAPDVDDGYQRQLDALEARVEALEADRSPAQDETASGADYTESARFMALGMQAQGCSPAEIRAALTKVCGKSPSPKHLARTLRRWSGQGESDG